MSRSSLLVLLHVALLARTASAQPPVLANIGSTATGRTFEARADYTSRDLKYDEHLWSIELRGQYVTPDGLGGYVTLPLSFAQTIDDPPRSAERGFGNLGLGGIYVGHASCLDLFVRGGVALDLADDDFTLSPGAMMVSQPTHAVPSGYGHWLRAAGGLRTTRDGFQYGVEVGLDLLVDGPLADGVGWLGHLAGSIGWARRGVGVSFGVAYLEPFETTDLGLGDDFALGFDATFDVDVSTTTNLVGTLGFNPHESINGLSVGLGVRVQL